MALTPSETRGADARDWLTVTLLKRREKVLKPFGRPGCRAERIVFGPPPPGAVHACEVDVVMDARLARLRHGTDRAKVGLRGSLDRHRASEWVLPPQRPEPSPGSDA